MQDENVESWMDELSQRIANLLDDIESGGTKHTEFFAALAELKIRGFQFVHTQNGPLIEPIYAYHRAPPKRPRRNVN